MSELKVCGGIVLFNPETDLLRKNIDAVIGQLDRLFLFDNGSQNTDEIDELLAGYDTAVYERSETNRGIAYALNRINQYALDNGYEWVLTLDQDSVCSDNMIAEYSRFTTVDRVAMICPFVLNNNKYSMNEYRSLDLPEMDYITRPNDCITSACMCRTDINRDIGGYNEDLFIDYVDTEINCRLLDCGYRIVRANRAYLIQSMGKAKYIRAFDSLYRLTHIDVFRKMKAAAVYSDFRLYYQARNSRYVYRHFRNAGRKLSPAYMNMLFCYFMMFYPKERSRAGMLKSIISGLRDSRRM